MFERLEQYLVPLVIAGALVALVGLFWLIRRGFKEGWGWGFAALVPPLQLLFWWQRPKAATAPWAVILVGAAISLGTIGAVQYANRIDLGERERVEKGDRWLTLTGWDREDYSFLPRKKDAAVLQMANKDVDDKVVALLAGFDSLKELDLSDTAITDASLPVLASLPALADLKLDNTAITDAGFREHLLKKESLMKLSLERMTPKTGVQAKTLREWKSGKKGREYLHTTRKVAP